MSSDKSQSSGLQYAAHPFKLPIEEVKSFLQADVSNGLTEAAAESAKAKYGENKASGQAEIKWYSVLLKQVSNAMILVGRTVLDISSKC